MGYTNDSGTRPFKTDVRLSYARAAYGLGKVKGALEWIGRLIPKRKPDTYGENYFIDR